MTPILSAPLMVDTLTPDTMPGYLAALREAGVSRVFLAVDRPWFFRADRAPLWARMREALACFSANGLSCGVWIATLGYGGPLDEEMRRVTAGFTHLRTYDGREAEDAFCPSDPAFRAFTLDFVREAAACHPDLIMLDDELCQSVRPGLGCFCDRHRAAIARAAGVDRLPDDIPSAFFTGRPDRFRPAFLRAEGDSLREFCRAVRETVDEVDPAIRVGLCASFTSFDIEGADSVELARILAGDGTAPFLRFSGAPYWCAPDIRRFAGQRLGAIVEFTRMQEAWCRDSGVEVFAEDDSYPRPRYRVPASLLECFHTPLTATGREGCLKYFFDYYAPLDHERGYLAHHKKGEPLRDFVRANFPSLPPAGVRLYTPMRRFGTADLPAPFAGEQALMGTAFSPAADLFAVQGIPVTYEGVAPVAAVFGYDLPADLSVLPSRVILDGRAAVALTAQGVDLGILSSSPTSVAPAWETFPDGARLPQRGTGAGYAFTLAEDARVLSWFETGDVRVPASFRVTRQGREYYVLTSDTAFCAHDADIFLAPERGRDLRAFLAETVPAVVGETESYLLWHTDGATSALLVGNFSADGTDAVTVDLGCVPGRVLAACGAQAERDGRVLRLSPLPPYGMAAVVVGP